MRRDVYAQDGAQGHLSFEGLGGDPKHRGAIRPKPQCKLSRMSHHGIEISMVDAGAATTTSSSSACGGP
jgi:hypothetical protein